MENYFLLSSHFNIWMHVALCIIRCRLFKPWYMVRYEHLDPTHLLVGCHVYASTGLGRVVAQSLVVVPCAGLLAEASRLPVWIHPPQFIVVFSRRQLLRGLKINKWKKERNVSRFKVLWLNLQNPSFLLLGVSLLQRVWEKREEFQKGNSIFKKWQKYTTAHILKVLSRWTAGSSFNRVQQQHAVHNIFTLLYFQISSLIWPKRLCLKKRTRL